MGIGLLVLVLELVAHQFESILVKMYGKNHRTGGMLFNAIICLFAMIYSFVTDKGTLQFPAGVVIYGLVNSTMYAVGFYAGFLAFKTGSFGLTKLFSSFGVILSTFYGILFLGEPMTEWSYVALFMILLSIFLMNYRKDDGDTQKITLKWVISILLVVLSNVAITIIGRIQFEVYGDTYKNEFLILSLGGATLLLVVLALIFEADSFKTTFKYGLVYGAGAGVFNGAKSLFSLVIYNYLPISFVSPAKAGLGVVFGFLVSMVFFKEKFSCRQIISVFIGIAAVVIMSL